MSHDAPANPVQVTPAYQPLIRAIGLDAEGVFAHPDIVAWRKLPDRENCTLDVTSPEAGGRVRLHIKRHHASRRSRPAEEEVGGYRLLQQEHIPTAPLVAWGRLADGRSFVITEDLYGYTPADKLIAAGAPFDRLLEPTADLAAKLHNAGLHHRDLYLCHFMAKAEGDAADLKLIDVARVRRLPSFLTRRRWIVKDLAQFWYSTLALPITGEQRTAWLARYAHRRALGEPTALRRSIERKARWIERHDRSLRRKQPTRNVSIPQP